MLLVLRAGAAMVLTLAFGRPLWRPESADPVAFQRGQAVVLVVDASASMQRASGGTMLFDQAKGRAADILSRLDPTHDLAGLVLLDASPGAILPELSANIPHIAATIEDSTATLERGDSAAALARVTALMDHPAARRQRRLAVVLTDMQATQWRGVAAPNIPGVEWRIEAFGGREDENLAVLGVTAAPAPLGKDQAALAIATIGNDSSEPRSLPVRFALGGAFIGETFLDVPAWSERDTSHPLSPSTAGWAMLSASIENDDFEWDNTARAGIAIIDAPPAILITSRDPSRDPASAAWFAHAAVQSSDGRTPIVLTPDNLAPLRNVVTRAVIADAGPLDAGALIELESFAKGGGTVIWFIDSQQPALASANRELSVWPLSLAAPGALTVGSALVASGDLTHSIRDSLSEALHLWDGQRVPSVAVATTRPGAEPLLSDDPGVLLARRTVGAGSIIMCAIDLHPARSDVVRSPMFPALIHALLNEGRSATRCGLAASVGEIPLGFESALAHPGEILEAGRAAGVNIDPRESDFRSLAPADFPASPSSPDAENPHPNEAVASPPIELWPWFITTCAALLLAEGWFRQPPSLARSPIAREPA